MSIYVQPTNIGQQTYTTACIQLPVKDLENPRGMALVEADGRERVITDQDSNGCWLHFIDVSTDLVITSLICQGDSLHFICNAKGGVEQMLKSQERDEIEVHYCYSNKHWLCSPRVCGDKKTIIQWIGQKGKCTRAEGCIKGKSTEWCVHDQGQCRTANRCRQDSKQVIHV